MAIDPDAQSAEEKPAPVAGAGAGRGAHGNAYSKVYGRSPGKSMPSTDVGSSGLYGLGGGK